MSERSSRAKVESEPEAERFDASRDGPDLAYEHFHRYVLAQRAVAGLHVLDLASGSGYGTKLLATSAASVTSLDLSTVGLDACPRGICGDAQALPFRDASFDAVVCFEAIEHVPDPGRLVDEARRVLRDPALFIVSTPDRAIYTERAGHDNEHHVAEMNRDEFSELLRRRFSSCRILGQGLWAGSWIGKHTRVRNRPDLGERSVQALRWDGGFPNAEFRAAEWSGEANEDQLPMPVYLLALCANSTAGRKRLAERIPDDTILHDAAQWLLGQYTHVTQQSDAARGRLIDELSAARTSIARLEGERDAAAAAIASLEAERASAAARIAELERDESAAREAIQSLERDESAAREAIQSLERERDAAASRIADLERDESAARDAIGALERERDEATRAIAALEAELAQAGAALRELEEERARSGEAIDALQRDRDAAQAAFAEAEERTTQALEEGERAVAAASAVEGVVAERDEEIQRARTVIEGYERDVERAREDAANREQRLTEAANQIDAAESALATVRQELATATSDAGRVRRERDGARAAIDELSVAQAKTETELQATVFAFSELTRNFETLVEQLALHEEGERSLSEQVEVAREAVSEKEGELRRARAAIVDKDGELQRARAAIVDKDGELQRARAAIAGKDGELDAASGAAETMRSELVAARATIDSHVDQLADAERAIGGMEEDRAEARSAIEEMRDELAAARAEIEDRDTQIGRARRDLEAGASRVAELESIQRRRLVRLARRVSDLKDRVLGRQS